MNPYNVDLNESSSGPENVDSEQCQRVLEGSNPVVPPSPCTKVNKKLENGVANCNNVEKKLGVCFAFVYHRRLYICIQMRKGVL